ncbi:hypothetical protein GCM10009839_38730 [Catenulispora yoronensis]|uniref:Uncharacterized protein n=1 Tax=Catenulispora yoronensis TaxID=450799 RepID=A0ABP5G043_9ACTN
MGGGWVSRGAGAVGDPVAVTDCEYWKARVLEEDLYEIAGVHSPHITTVRQAPAAASA